MSALWKFLTDFGDTAVTVPLAMLMAGFLAATRQWRLAVGWGVAVLGCAGVIGALKLAFADCGAPIAGPVLSSPSGHSAMSVVVYGGFATILGQRLRRPARALLIAGAAFFAVAIAVSRVVLHDHSRIEVAVGLGVGAAALAALVVTAARSAPAELPLGKFAMAAAVIALLFHGERWPAEQAIHRLAGWFAVLRPWCG